MKAVRLIIFVKAPVAGKVKTRLGYSIGMRNAARLYVSMCRSYLKKIRHFSAADIEVWATPDTRHPFFLWCYRELGINVRRQPEGDLGERMYRSIKSSLRRYSTVILTGSDMPEISVADLEQTLSQLGEGVDVVFTPALDGGYGLVAMRKPVRSIFFNMKWSCENVLATSLTRLRRDGLKYFLLKSQNDIDTYYDYRKYFKR